MSAFQVHNAHINALANYAIAISRRVYRGNFSYYSRAKGCRVTLDDEQAVGQMLTDANNESVCYRYRQPLEPIPFVHSYGGGLLEPVQILKAVNCLNYQSCEVEDWEDSDAKAVLDAIMHMAFRQLPGYDDAAWEIVPTTAIRGI